MEISVHERTCQVCSVTRAHGLRGRFADFCELQGALIENWGACHH
jgi:hypothetical protein